MFFQSEGRKINLVLSEVKETKLELFLCKLVKIGLLSLSIESGSKYSNVLLKRMVKFRIGFARKKGGALRNSI